MKPELVRAYFDDLLHPFKTYKKIQKYQRDSWYAYGIFGEQYYQWLNSNITSGDAVIDIGSAMGYSIAYFAFNLNVSHIYGFENNHDVHNEAQRFLAKNARRDIIDNYLCTATTDVINRFTKHNCVIKCCVPDDAHKIITDDLNLQNVHAAQILYDNGVQELEKVLKRKGFNVKHKKRNDDSFYGEVGWIYGWR